MPAADGKVETLQDFEAIRLEQNLLGGIFGYGLEQGIVPTAAGRDIRMQAQAGTGKTAAFTIECGSSQDIAARHSSIEHVANALACRQRACLALQTERVRGATWRPPQRARQRVIGGTSERGDSQALRRSPHVVNGTSGRVVDTINRGSLDTRGIKILTLDEVDGMLGESFVDPVNIVCGSCDAKIDVVLMSC